MKKIISFSLWGKNPAYSVGMRKNVQLAKEFFPDWKVKIYFDDSADPQTILRLGFEPNVELEHLEKPIYGMFWRFFAMAEKDADYVIIRDADSRLDEREAKAVNDWIASGKSLHIIRDHPCHGLKIMGGMWGCKAEKLRNIKDLILAWGLQKEGELQYMSDQVFLADVVYPMFKNDNYINDEFFNTGEINKFNFAIERKNYKFVGERYDEKDERNQNDYLILKDWLLTRM
jgi:hypothetical protein